MIRPAALALALLWPLTGHAGEQIPCWKAQALLTWSGGDNAKAEKLALWHGYSRAQIAEVRERCKI
jgi:hypothetical protein